MKQHILVLGAGFGGLWSALSATRLLEMHGRSDVVVSVLAPQAELRIRPRFYEPDAASLMAPLDALFTVTGVRFIQGVARHVDVPGKRVEYVDGQGNAAVAQYDQLVLATGSGLARSVEHAFDVDRIEEAVRLEEHLKALARLPYSVARNTVVVAGGGFTGIETATEMPARLREVLGKDARVRVIVVDRGQAIGASQGEEIARSIAEASAELGVEWRLNASVEVVDNEGVTLADGQRIEARTVIWTTGVQASALTAQIPGERDRLGRLHVDEHLRVIGQESVFAAGDTAYAATDDLGNHALMTCQHAIPLGRHAGNNAAARLIGAEPVVYRQPKYVTCLDLGGWGAVFTEGWDRQVKLVREEGKALKRQINTQWIYPPVADKAVALAAADPMIPIA